MHNVNRSLDSSNAFVDVTVVDRPKNLRIDDRTIVVNPNLTPVILGEPPLRQLPAFSSTVLVGTEIDQGDACCCCGFGTSRGWPAS